MILKLRMLTNKGNGFRIFDNIKQIEYKYLDKTDELNEKCKENKIVYINYFPLNQGVVEIWITYESGLFDMMYTDDMFYIMNNNGKTCDTVTA